MTNRTFTVIENEWITLADGTRLAARIWMPDGADISPVPAVLEYLPYRKRDGTSVRDEATYPAFAEAGIAGIRVDIRGCGESDGVIDGEYTPRELSDACEVIAWIAAQPWSNGSVGMMGISWGGFNCLQVAALQPPALKAVISIASTVDRYNDDIHYKNGCHLYAQLSWAGTMFGYQSRPPDPALVGERWKEMWLHRLENEPFLMAEWLSHQRRDEFWKHGSICENFSAVKVPALVIAGWADGYRNTPLAAVEGMPENAKALIGPWVHKYPHFAWPKPRQDFLGEAIAWWNRWLRDEKSGADQLPQVRAYILDGVKPQPNRSKEPGFWVAKDRWEEPEVISFSVDAAGALKPGVPLAHAPANPVYIKSPLDTGTASGEYFTLKPDAELPGDQRVDDAGSLVVETAPLEETLDLLGRPVLTLKVSCDEDWANLCARLVDVHPDGTATRVSFGVINLAHRDGNAEPRAMEKGRPTTIRIVLDACGYRFNKGHRIRLSISTSYWPMILPPPVDPGVTIDLTSLGFGLPRLGAHEVVTVKEPENPDPLPKYISRKAGRTERTVTRDLSANRTDYRILEDTGLTEHPETGLATRSVRDELWSISPNDPLSMNGTSVWTCELQRSGWSVRTEATLRMRCTAKEWLLKGELIAYEGDLQVFEKTFEKAIPRDFT
ncbi:CocE/NonD family hydrolase [Microvirga sp. G4-2]|uniref:CocE/NonD family hydrolase n=1 Tax=Microvirga sp. G4-2 TaxID=3434467 RepID=UPI0040442302